LSVLNQHHDPRPVDFHAIDGLTRGTPLKHVESKLVFARGIQYLTKLVKAAGS
jgi:hypothetical protein